VIRERLVLSGLRAAGRGLYRLVRVGAAAAIAVAAAPVTLVAAGAFTAAWLRGLPPRRLFGAAAWCLPMVGVWLVAIALRPAGPTGSRGASPGLTGAHPAGAGEPAWLRVLGAPYYAWLDMWRLGAHGRIAEAAVTVAPFAIPLGLAAAGLAWAYRIFRMETGTGGLSPIAPAVFDARQWRRQVRTARGRIAAPGSIPLISPNGGVVTGATIRSVGHRSHPVAAIPYARLRSHQVVIGTTGTGKTTLLLRLWAGFMAAGLRRYAAGTAARPLLVVLDCKGGASSRKVADRARRVLRDAGARATAVWPDEATLSLWSLPPGRLVTTLLDLIEHGTGAAAYYADVMEALVSLAVGAPCGPPADSADFLSRLDADWLATAYAGSGDATAIATIRSVKQGFSDAALRFRTLWRRLGAGFEGSGGLADADAWYCILEGTAETAVAEAQARALVDILASFAVSEHREILLAVDEFSAVARRLPIWRLYERARSLGLAIQVSSQSWQGLAAAEDERYRIAATAEGGIWLLRTPHPGPVVEMAGSRPVVDTARRLAGGGPAWSDDGSSRLLRMPVLDADLVRRLDVGQAAYVYRGGVTFVQVKRLIGTQAALAGAPVPASAAPDRLPPSAARRPGGAPGAPGAPPVPSLPDVDDLLDEAFGALSDNSDT
jgi:hypothetical protein